MPDESPWFRWTLVAIGLIADLIAIVHFVGPLLELARPEAWAYFILIFGIGVTYLGLRPEGDFSVSSRLILVDIRRWETNQNIHLDEVVTYRVDVVRCRTFKSQYLYYPEYSADGQRTLTEVLNFSFQFEPVLANPGKFNLKIDLGPDCKFSKKYVIVSRSEYRDTFRDPASEHYLTRIVYPTKNLKVIMLFAQNKPCRSARVFRTVGATPVTEAHDPDIFGGRVLIWSKRRPQFNAGYRISWYW